MFTKSDKLWIKKNFVTNDYLRNELLGLARSSELDSLKEEFLTNLAKWKDELFNKIDNVLGQLKSAEQEKTILEAVRMKDKNLIHESRNWKKFILVTATLSDKLLS